MNPVIELATKHMTSEVRSLEDGMRILKNVSTNLASSVEWVKASCRSVRAAKEPNPYKDWSDEQIAEMILKEMIDE